MPTVFNNKKDIYTKDFQAIDISNTIGAWVDAFNNNALASTDHTWYLGEMLFNGILYTGLETIGDIPIKSLTNLNISSKSPQNIELDNFYLYFRNINKIKLLDQVTFDLSSYNTGHPMFFYVNSELGFRVSQEFKQREDEVMLFRFIISEAGVFQQCYVTAQRFGANVYDSAGEFYTVQGCQPLPAGQLKLKLDDGTIKRAGIKFDYHQIPDIVEIKDNDIPFNLRYITTDNKVNFNAPVITNVDPNHYLVYSTGTLNTVPNGKFTAQRILYDVYTNCLIMQYGNGVYDTMQEALSSLGNVNYPFPYNELMFIPLGIMFIKKGATNLADPDQCILVQHLNTTVNSTDSAFFAEDSYARGCIVVINNDIKDLQEWLQDVDNRLVAHVNNKNNPHHVTKDQIGLGNVDNYGYEDKGTGSSTVKGIKNRIKDDLDDYWIKKNVDDSTTGRLTIGGGIKANGVQVPVNYELNAQDWYFVVHQQRVYVGTRPDDAPNGSWSIST